MPLMVLGLVFVIALFAYYMLSTAGPSDSTENKNNKSRKDNEDDLVKNDNVIFLPNDLEKEKQKHKKK